MTVGSLLIHGGYRGGDYVVFSWCVLFMMVPGGFWRRMQMLWQQDCGSCPHRLMLFSG